MTGATFQVTRAEFNGGLCPPPPNFCAWVKMLISSDQVASFSFAFLCFPFIGSPLQFYVDAINSGHVTAYGPGLTHGTVNTLATFTIVTKDTGEGTIQYLLTQSSRSLWAC